MSKQEKLIDKRIAIFLEDGFDKNEYDLVRGIVEGAGGNAQVVSRGNLEVRPYEESNANRNEPVKVDSANTRNSTFDGVLLVSAVADQGQMAEDQDLKDFINREFEAHTPIVALGNSEKILEKTAVFEEIGSPAANHEADHIVRSQGVMYVKNIKDDQKFSDELIDFLTQS